MYSLWFGELLCRNKLPIFAPTFLILTLNVPSQTFVHFGLPVTVWFTKHLAAMLFCVMIWFSCMSPLGGGHNMVHRLNWCLIEWWKPQGLFWAPVSVWSCFTLYSDRGHVIAVLYSIKNVPQLNWVIFRSDRTKPTCLTCVWTQEWEGNFQNNWSFKFAL